MISVNIHEYISFDNDKWLMYQVPDINFWTDTKTKGSAYCYAEHGKLNIFISSDWLNHRSNEFKIELVKHELAHGMFGHIGFMKGKTKAQRQLFNIVADCSIHVNTADPKILEEGTGGKPCTYDNCGLKQLPPEYLYHKLWDAAQEKMDKFQAWVDEHLDDDFWKIKPNKDADLDSQIIKDSISSNLEKAIAKGVPIPDTIPGGVGGAASATDLDYDYLFNQPVPKEPWLSDLEQIIRNYNSKHVTSSYKREPRNPIHPDILQKGRATTFPKSRFLFAVDCSGSMNIKMIERAISTISQHIDPGENKLLIFDTKVSKVFDITDTDTIKQALRKYYGGTHLLPVFEYANANDQLVFYTDGGFWDIDNIHLASKFKYKPVFILTESWYHDSISKHAHVITTY